MFYYSSVVPHIPAKAS